MCIQDEVSTRINGSALPARGLKLLRCDQIRTGAGVLDEFRHAHTAVEVRDSSDDGFAFVNLMASSSSSSGISTVVFMLLK